MYRYRCLLLLLFSINGLAQSSEDCQRGFGIYTNPCPEQSNSPKPTHRLQLKNPLHPDAAGSDSNAHLIDERAITEKPKDNGQLSTSDSPHKSSTKLINSVSPERLLELEIMGRMEGLEQKSSPERESRLERRKTDQARQKKLQRLIDRNSIGVGMSPRQVIQSWGKPTRIVKISERIERWVFQRRDGRDQIIYLEDAEVFSWE